MSSALDSVVVEVEFPDGSPASRTISFSGNPTVDAVRQAIRRERQDLTREAFLMLFDGMPAVVDYHKLRSYATGSAAIRITFQERSERILKKSTSRYRMEPLADTIALGLADQPPAKASTVGKKYLSPRKRASELKPVSPAPAPALPPGHPHEPGSPPYDELLAALQYVLGELKPFHGAGDGGRKSARSTLSKHQFSELFAAVERIFGSGHSDAAAGVLSHHRAISFALERAVSPSVTAACGGGLSLPNPVPVVQPPTETDGDDVEKSKKKSKKGAISMRRGGSKSSSVRLKTSTVGKKSNVDVKRAVAAESTSGDNAAPSGGAAPTAASPSAAPLRRWAQRAQVTQSVSSSDREALKRMLEDRYKALLEQLSNDDVSVAEETDVDEEELEYDELPPEVSSVLLAASSGVHGQGHPAAADGNSEPAAPLTDEQHATKTREEFIVSEGRYVASLRVLIREYMLPLRKSGVLSEGTVATVFSNIKTIYRMHLELFRDLSAKDGRPAVNFTDQLGLFVPYLKLYTIYVNNYNLAIEAVAEQNRTNPAFRDHCKRLFALGHVKLDLMSYLIMPIQRIPRYEMLLRDLLRHTDPAMPEHAKIETQLKAVATINQHVNSSKRTFENFQKIVSIQQLLVFPRKLEGFGLADKRDRELLREGLVPMFLQDDPVSGGGGVSAPGLAVPNGSGGLAGGESSEAVKARKKRLKTMTTRVEDHYMAVFNDLVLLAKPTKEKKFRVAAIWPGGQVAVRAAEDGQHHFLETPKDGMACVLFPESDRRAWLASISKLQ